MAIKNVVVGFEPRPDLVDRIRAVLDDGGAEVVVAASQDDLAAAVVDADVLFGGRVDARTGQKGCSPQMVSDKFGWSGKRCLAGTRRLGDHGFECKWGSCHADF